MWFRLLCDDWAVDDEQLTAGRCAAGCRDSKLMHAQGCDRIDGHFQFELIDRFLFAAWDDLGFEPLALKQNRERAIETFLLPRIRKDGDLGRRPSLHGHRQRVREFGIRRLSDELFRGEPDQRKHQTSDEAMLTVK